MSRRCSAAALLVSAALAVAGCSSAGGSPTAAHGSGCPPGAKCPAPPLPATTVQLVLNGRHYVRGFDAPNPGGDARLTVAMGQLVRIAVTIKAPAGVKVGDVWLTVNGYPSGFGSAPTGRFKPLIHRPGAIRATDELTTTWKAAKLFKSSTLDLTLDFDLGDAWVGSPLARLTVTQ